MSNNTVNTLNDELGVGAEVDPLATDKVTQFDYDAVSRGLGEPQEEAEMNKARMDALTLVLAKIFDWVFSMVDMKRPDALRIVGRRMVALTWVMDPERFNVDKDASAHKLAQQLGISEARFANLTASVSRRFGITNRFQSHNWRDR